MAVQLSYHPPMQGGNASFYSFCNGYSTITGKEPGMPQYGRPDGDNMNDDRLQHILNETSSMMPKGTPTPQQQMAQQLQLQQQQLQQLHLNNLDDSQHSDNDSKSPNSRDVSSPFSKDYLSRRLKKYENDDIPQEKIAKIYHKILTMC